MCASAEDRLVVYSAIGISHWRPSRRRKSCYERWHVRICVPGRRGQLGELTGDKVYVACDMFLTPNSRVMELAQNPVYRAIIARRVPTARAYEARNHPPPSPASSFFSTSAHQVRTNNWPRPRCCRVPNFRNHAVGVCLRTSREQDLLRFSVERWTPLRIAGPALRTKRYCTATSDRRSPDA